MGDEVTPTWSFPRKRESIDKVKMGPRLRGDDEIVSSTYLRLSRMSNDLSERRSWTKLLFSSAVDPAILSGKPIIRGRRLAVEHVLGMLAAGDTSDTIIECYPWLEREDILACLAFARR